MKIEIYADGPAKLKWLMDVLPGYQAAAAEDDAAADAKFKAKFKADFQMGHSGEVKTDIEPEAPKSEPAKRTRKAKADEATSAGPQEAPQITTNPEDRKPVEVEAVESVEEAEVVDVFEEAPAPKVYSRQDVKDAMQVYVAKHGMDALAANAGTLLGAKKLSEIPEDAVAFEAAVKRLEAASA
jgi:archaellum component FlaD/FlaE